MHDCVGLTGNGQFARLLATGRTCIADILSHPLNSRLQARDGMHEVTAKDQMMFACQVAQGMAFLESKSIVHGHLAA